MAIALTLMVFALATFTIMALNAIYIVILPKIALQKVVAHMMVLVPVTMVTMETVSFTHF